MHNIGATDITAVQGLDQQGHLWSLQAHPEFDKEVMYRVLELTRPAITEEEYQKAVGANTGGIEQQVTLELLANFVLS